MDLNRLVTACREEFGCDVVLSRWDPVTSSVVLSQIISQTPGKGNGTQCIKYLLQELERIGVKKIWLLACPIGAASPKKQEEGVIKLAEWYHRFGFEFVRYSKCGDYISNAEMEMVV
jgi:hypothetical protein